MGKNNTKREKMMRNEAYALKHKKKRKRTTSGTPRLSEPTFSSSMPSSRGSFPAICSACQAPTTLPFEPTSGKPVFCRACFVAQPPRVSVS